MHRLLFTLCLMLLILGSVSAQTEEWTVELAEPGFSPTLYPGALQPDSVLVSAGHQLLRVKHGGDVAWSIEHDSPLQTPPTAADLNGDGTFEIAVADHYGQVLVFDADGGLQWSRDFETPTGSFKHIAAANVHPSDGLELLVGFDDGWLNCLSADGRLLWRFFGDKFRVGGISIGDATGDGFTDIVYGTDNGNVYCLDGWGFVQWRYQEIAPYGRSGPNLADLDGDGAAEVLITRSNQGTATCQMALDARTGAFKWRVPTYMQGYHSNAIADLNGDGMQEVVSADKGNVLIAVQADGSTLWETALEGRGIFFAPIIADVDGDGALDIVTGVRGSSPEDGACVYRVSARGEVLDRLAIGSSANASPAVGDLNGDGSLDVIVCLEGPNRLVALTWGGGGEVAWPSVRGGSDMRGSRIAMGTPMRDGTRDDFGGFNANASHRDFTWGEVRLATDWSDGPPPEEAFLCVSTTRDDGALNHRVELINRDRRDFSLYTANVSGRMPVDVTVSLHNSNGSIAGRITNTFELVLPSIGLAERVEEILSIVKRPGEKLGADMSLLHQSAALLQRELTDLAELETQGAPTETIAREAAKIEAKASRFISLCFLSESVWTAGKDVPFWAWEKENPWIDRYHGEGYVEDPPQPVVVQAFRDEFESRAIFVCNLSAEPMDLRCTFTEPVLNKRPEREPELAKRVTLRRAIPVPKRGGGYVNDALPKLDRSGVITLAPGEVRELWIVVDTHGLEDGEYELDLYFGSMTHPPHVQRMRIDLNVWQVQLPKGQYAQMNWSRIGLNEASDQALQDMLDHGVSVAYAPALPALPVDENGNRNGDPDWTAFDASLERLPENFRLMFHGALRPQWPADVSAEVKAASNDTAVASGIKALAEHMNAIDWDYDRWAFYFIDEPFLTGRTVIPELREKCEFVRGIDPNIRLYANPTGKMKVEYLDEFKDLIDVWQPEINFLKRDPDLLAWFQENAKTLWAYEATDPGKELMPLGYYRSLGWLSAKLGLSGAGFWVYQYHDLWWPLEVGNWAVVYPAGDEVVPSRRWEATRDGQEDYLALQLLREEIEKARNGHRFEDADKGEALLNKALDEVVGWQIGTIDEITRQTRDYELDYDLLMTYRQEIAKMIIELRASGAHNPIHFLGD